MHCSLVIRQKLLAINTKLLFTLSICGLVKFAQCQEVRVTPLNVPGLGNCLDLCTLFLKWGLGPFSLVTRSEFPLRENRVPYSGRLV